MPPSPFRSFAHLPKGFQPAMPDKCVGCLAPKPDGRVTIWTMSSNWLALLTPVAMVFSRATRVRFPACAPCAWRIRLRRLASFGISIALMLGAGYLVIRMTPTWPKLLRRLAAIAAAFAAFIPFLLLEQRVPHAIELTLDGEVLEYEFREIEFAAEFRMMNRDALRE